MVRMAIDKRTTRLGMLALVSTLLIGAARYAPVVPAGCRGRGVPRASHRREDARGADPARARPHLRLRGSDHGRQPAHPHGHRRLGVIKSKKDRDALFDRLSGPLQMPVIDLHAPYEPCFEEPLPMHQGQLLQHVAAAPLKEDVDEDAVSFLKERSEDYPASRRRAVEAGLPVRATRQPRRRLHGRHHERRRTKHTRTGLQHATSASARSVSS